MIGTEGRISTPPGKGVRGTEALGTDELGNDGVREPGNGVEDSSPEGGSGVVPNRSGWLKGGSAGGVRSRFGNRLCSSGLSSTKGTGSSGSGSAASEKLESNGKKANRMP